MTVGFAVDPDGNIVAARLFPSDAPPECGRFVMDALPRWKWRPAVDAAGAPALSARLVVYVQLPDRSPVSFTPKTPKGDNMLNRARALALVLVSAAFASACGPKVDLKMAVEVVSDPERRK